MNLNARCIRSLALTLPLVAAGAYAQVSAYGSVSLTNFGFSNNANDYSYKSDTGGLIGGAYFNFPIDSRLTAGIDARVGYGFGARGGTSVAAAFRVGFVPEHVALRPYVQLGGGVLTSTYNSQNITGPVLNGTTGNQTVRSTGGGAEFAVGLDIRMTDRLDLRLPEIGAIAGTSIGSAFFDAGIVYHFHPRKS